MASIEFLESPARYMLFTGKGGVGKTSLSCATAITLADRGKRVLLVSTDPASNLDEVLDTRLSNIPAPISGVDGLYAMNIDPEEAARQYREKMVSPYRGVLPEASVRSIEEQLSGACTVEIAAFDEFSKLLGNTELTGRFDHIILDTAPTGHTLRLLALPSAWSRFIETNTGGTSCLGPLAGLQAQHALYKEAVNQLSDPATTTIILVSRAEKSALQEAARTRKELVALGIANHHLALNGIFKARDNNDSVAEAFEKRCREALRGIPQGISALPISEIPLLPFGLSGIVNLRAMLQSGDKISNSLTGAEDVHPDLFAAMDMSVFIEEIAHAGKGVIMTMGKGGVGKTTIASAIAAALAKKGHRVHLSTTDPAAHLNRSLGNNLSGLSVGRINPAEEVKSYSSEVLKTAGMGLDKQGRQLLEEDLRSPCTEEIAVFRAFAREVENGKDGFVVLDTAPTGHTLLLLDATESYHRQVTRTMSGIPESVRALLPRLRDPGFTKIFIVTLPEATPVHEAAQLQQDLKRAGITPYAWIINQSLSPLAVTDDVLTRKKHQEARFIVEVQSRYSERFAIVPWISEGGEYSEWLSCIIEGNHKPVEKEECCAKF